MNPAISPAISPFDAAGVPGDAAERAIAADLLAARAHRMRVAPASARWPGLGVAQAYRIAARVRDLRVRRGEHPVGRKLGFTNRGIWAEYGVSEPMWAHVYDTTVHRLADNRATVPLAGFAAPRLEPEIVLHFHRAPPPPAGLAGAALAAAALAVLDCVDWIAHGFEIVDTHVPDWKFTLADTIVEFGLHGALYVGMPEPAAELADTTAGLLESLGGFGLELRCGGEPRDRGRGANVLDNPAAAVAHAIGAIAREPRFAPIAAGEIVTTGTVTAAWPVRPGETWSTVLQGLRLPGIALAFV